MAVERYGALPFEEQIAYFRRKLNLPTAAWTDLWEAEHTRAFSVAGATSLELLDDLRTAVERAIAEGTTLATFRKEFDAIAVRYGWSYNGERGWRTRVILETNLRVSYQAGRYEQMTDPEMLKERPFWMYKHGDSVHPRAQHLAWDGLVLPFDDVWWHTHYPLNGWGCKCKVFALSHDDLRKLGKSKPDKAPPILWYPWTNPRTGEVIQVPKGIDPGWAYNVGEAALRGRVGA